MSDYNPGAPGAQRKLVFPDKETSFRHLMAAAEFSTLFHRCHPQSVCSGYTFHFLPHELHTQYESVYVLLPSVQKPHRTPTGPASSQPQHPFDAEKSFPSVCMSVIIWQFSLPHFGHLIAVFSSLFFETATACFRDSFLSSLL